MQILPILLIGTVVFWMAIRHTPSMDKGLATLIFASIAVLLFSALLTFRDQSAWNLVLLLAFAASLGAAIAQMVDQQAISLGFELLGIIVFCLFLGAVIGRRLRDSFDEIGAILWFVSWAYLLGWAVLILLRLDPIFYLTWSTAGLVLFTGLAAAWFSKMQLHLKKASSVSAAVDLFLVSINLGIAALILLGVEI